MKRTFITIGLVLTATASFYLLRPAAKAAADRIPVHDVVVIQLSSTGHSFNNENGYSYQYQGLVIWNSSSSANAPKFPNEVIPSIDNTYLTNAADGIAQILDQGFARVSDGKDGTITFVRTR
jgi:hypothetical protein